MLRIACLCLLAASPSAIASEIVFVDGIEDCSMMVDDDLDRLIDCDEILRLQTDPSDEDTDDDGFLDGDEVLGSLEVNGQPPLDLAALGTDPRRKTIFLEIDWVDDATGCAMHSHRPTAAEVSKLIAAFAHAPVPFATGALPGVQLIVDYGQGGASQGGNQVGVPGGVILGSLGTDFDAYKSSNFSPARNGYFHYMLAAHQFTDAVKSSGTAEIGGDESIVSTACYRHVADRHLNTMMHELGHNLDLRHGGKADDCNEKPNYNSVMNYRYQMDGIDVDCNASPDGVLDYSNGSRLDLDENNLDEKAGVCGIGYPVEWLFGDDGYHSNLSINVNPYDYEVTECGGTHTFLNDRNDWVDLSLKVLPTPGTSQGNGVVETVICRGPTVAQ